MKKTYFFLIFILFSSPAWADEPSRGGIIVNQLIKEDGFGNEASYPILTSRFVADVNLNDEYQSSDRKDEFKSTSSKSRLYSSFNISKNFSINSFFRLTNFQKSSETSRRDILANGGGDRSFEDEGIITQELNISYNNEKHALVLGKFDLNFGSAWRWDRGIWNHNIADNYRQREKLGFNGIYRIGDAKKTGRYKFGYAIFTNDRKNFDNSTITQRDSDSKSDAVAGDTRSLKSYNLTLNIDFDFAEREKLSYNFSYVDLAINSRASSVAANKIDSQKGFAAGMNYKYPFLENLDLDALFEYSSIKNYNGNSDIGERYLTGNIIATIYQNWNATFGYSQMQNIEVKAFGYDQNLTEISFGYQFKKNNFFDKLIFQVGYKNQRNNYKTSLESRNSLGALMRYQKNF